MEAVEIFYGSLMSSTGGFFKSIQMAKLADLDTMKAELSAFVAQPDIEVLHITHQFNDGLMSVLVHYKKI